MKTRADRRPFRTLMRAPMASVISACTAAALLAACASTPLPNANLEAARSAYQQASNDPTVSQVATRELQSAQQALARADASFKAGDAPADVDHYAYLARQQTAVAVQTGKLADADKSSAEAKARRDGIVIESRTREAETQRLIAEERLAAVQASQLQADASRQRAASLEAQLTDLKARETERGMVLTGGDVLFETGKATLTPGAARTGDQLATFLGSNPSRRVLIEGYTDSTGSDATNLELSQRRADAVRIALAQRGIGADRVDSRGLGEAYAVASNDTSAGRQLNRRVEVVFSDATAGFKLRRN